MIGEFMRVSVIKNDEGFSPSAHLCEVYLNGEILHRCHTADEELGVAYCYEKDANGYYITDGDHFKTVEVRGEVKIVVPIGFVPP